MDSFEHQCLRNLLNINASIQLWEPDLFQLEINSNVWIHCLPVASHPVLWKLVMSPRGCWMFLSCSFCFACKMTHGKQEKITQEEFWTTRLLQLDWTKRLVHTKTKVQHQQQPILPDVEGDLAVALVFFFFTNKTLERRGTFSFPW